MNSVEQNDKTTRQDFADRTALVTGGNSGIGRVVAARLAARGAHVIVSGRDAARGARAVAAIRAEGGQVDFVQADLREVAQVRALAEWAVDIGGGHVDILVNNAGVYPFSPSSQVSERDFDWVFAVNVKAPFYLVAQLAPLMAERRHGSIVNLVTAVASFGKPGMALYGSSKAALQLLTKSWAAEYGRSGLRVNAVCPGPTFTEGTAAIPEVLEREAAQSPLNRVGTPEEVAAAVVFLASEEASLMHGVVLPVDGGRLAV
jgi:NAD(P)-dependent dehydrogenase (short-subunit alcohol dehydrogenase family)